MLGINNGLETPFIQHLLSSTNKIVKCGLYSDPNPNSHQRLPAPARAQSPPPEHQLSRRQEGRAGGGGGRESPIDVR